jgi:transcriptional regulator with XRE-family HTH domain
MGQAALARVIGISRSYLAAVEQGRRHPTPQTVTAISRALTCKALIAPKAEQGRTRLQPKRASPTEAPARHRPHNSGTARPVHERLALGLNQPEFAQRAGIKREYLSMIEHGRCKPGPSTRARIEAALKPTEH